MMSKELYMDEKITLKIGDIIDLNFKKINDAEKFANGYNRGTKVRDFDYDEFECEMERRGFDFAFKVWSMLRIHAEEEKFRKAKATIVGLPRRFKTHITNKILPQT